MAVAVYGLEPLEGETAFAFLVVRLRDAVDRDGLLDVLRFIAPLIPDADAFIDEFPDELEGALRMIGIPWSPPEAGHAVAAQRRLVEGAGAVGIEAAWFFQTGTSLPSEDDDEDEDDDDDEDDDELEDAPSPARASTSTGETVAGVPMRASTADESYWSNDPPTETRTMPIALVDDETEDEERRATSSPNLGQSMRVGSIGDADADDEPDDDDDLDDELEDVEDSDDAPAGEDDATWSHGPPPQVTEVRFPVDGYPEILDELDWEDFGLAFKLAGPALPGENTVLLGFHTLWLAPYSERYRNTAVTIDPKHHSAHLWVDRFAVPCSASEQVHHLLWILSMIDRVLPVVHARFAPATMAQKYGGLVGESAEPFVLGGNPLLAVYAEGGEAAVDAWLASQTTWSKEELAQMLRELAIEIASGEGDHHDEGGVRELQAPDEDDGDDEDDDEDEDDDDSVDDEDDEDDEEDEDEPEGSDDEDRGRHIASSAGAVLQARAAAGTLDPRAAEQLLPVLEGAEPDDQRRRVIVEILGALRYQPAVPALIRVLGDGGTEELVAATAAALGAIADPAAIPALARIVTGGAALRPVAAEALQRCLEAAPDARPTLDESVLAALRFSSPSIPDDDQEIN